MRSKLFPGPARVLVVLACSAGFTGLLQAREDAGIPDDLDAGLTADASVPIDPKVASIRALVEGTLDVGVDPQSFFDVSLGDEDALRLEIVRLEALLRAADEASRPSTPPKTHDRRIDAGVADGGGLQAEIERLGVDIWASRMALDRARLEFYSLDRGHRDEILAAHKARQEAAKPKETDAERQAREAEAERQRVLEQARAARTEAERLVGEELARLIAIETTVTTRRAEFREERAQLAARKDTVFGWQRHARDAKSNGDADTTYDAIRETLHKSRNDLDHALTVMASDSTHLPTLGPNALTMIPDDVPTDRVKERRTALEKSLLEAHQEERTLREERTEALMGEITTLNRERLALLPYLSNEKREAITGFTVAGWDQARAEARHLSLVMRNHRHIATTWIQNVRNSGWQGASSWHTIAMGLPWFALMIAFAWARRQTPTLLELADKKFGEADKAERRTTPSMSRRVARFLSNVHRPLEWLLFGLVIVLLLPPITRDLPEVQLLVAVCGWILGGALVVDTINALAMGPGNIGLSRDDLVAALRLRSLQLVSRSIVVFALFLTLSAGLVGVGTIYNWVWSTYWVVALPVFVLLVHWWRPTVFERTERARNKSPLQKWVLANQAGWTSFFAAALGAIQLFLTGAIKMIRTWLSEFDLARRIHAYLFRRELDRLGEHGRQDRLRPLGAELLAELHPERASMQWWASPADEVLDALTRRIEADRGGVVVIIGSRGMGKSSILRKLRANANAVEIACNPLTTVDHIKERASQALGVVLIDDAHLLIKPVIGGLGAFDDLVTLARSASAKRPWIMTMDSALWPFLKRARDGRPMFDTTHVLESWTEDQIGTLLLGRSIDAGIEPRYDDLLENGSSQANEDDRLDAIEAKEVGYMRMLWDHARGNPGIALEAWRSSLGVDDDGNVHVRPLQVPDTTALESLSDSSLFVLRAIIQLSPAEPADIARATRLGVEQVLNAMRYGQSQGFIYEHEGRVQIAWSWIRPVMRILERRHLLVMS